MARKPTGLPPGLDRFVIFCAHDRFRVDHGMLHVEGADAHGAFRSEDIPIDVVEQGQARTFPVPPEQVLMVTRLDCRLHLDDGSELVFQEDLAATGRTARYATFGAQTAVMGDTETEMIGLLVLDDPAPLAARVAIPWDDMDILNPV